MDAFPQTNWGQIEALKGAHGQGREDLELLNLLSASYWSPIYQFLLHQGISEQDALDLAQDFFAFALKSRLFGKADRQRGRLRSFLLRSLKNFVAKHYRRENAAKRQPEQGIASLDQLMEDAYFQPASLMDKDTPDAAFHRAWLREVIVNVLRAMEDDFAQKGQRSHFDLFRSRVVTPEFEGIDPPSLEQQAKDLGLDYKEAANQIQTAKRAFRRILAKEVERYAVSKEDASHEREDVASLLGLNLHE